MLKNMSALIFSLLFVMQIESVDNQICEPLVTDLQDEEALRSKKCETFCCIEVSGNQHIGGNLTVGGDITAGNFNLGSTNAGDVMIGDESIAALFDIGFFSFNLAQETTRAISSVTINPGDSIPFPIVNISSAITAINSTQFSLPKAGTYDISVVISLESTDGFDTIDPMEFSVRIDGAPLPFTVIQNTNAQAQLVINDTLFTVYNPNAVLDINNTGTIAYNVTQGILLIQRISNITTP